MWDCLTDLNPLHRQPVCVCVCVRARAHVRECMWLCGGGEGGKAVGRKRIMAACDAGERSELRAVFVMDTRGEVC